MGAQKHKKEEPPYSPLNALGPFDLVARATLERMYRQKGGLNEDQARLAVDRLIKRNQITITKYTGLLKDFPLYQKVEK